MTDSPLTQLDRLMDRGSAIADSTTVRSVSDAWLQEPPPGWLPPAEEEQAEL
jgi:hypothetical protein